MITLAGHVLTEHAVKRIAERGLRPNDVEAVLRLGSACPSHRDRLIYCRRADLVKVPEKTARRLARLVVVVTRGLPPRVKTVLTPPDPWAYVKSTKIKSGR